MEEKNLILVVDLDGTLISEEISQKIYREAYANALERLREREIEIPSEFQEHNFLNYCKVVRRYEGFEEIYKSEYSQVLEKYMEELKEKEGKNARWLYTQLATLFVPSDIIILTANPEAHSIINQILPEISREKIIVVDGSAYVEEKRKVLESLKSFGKVLYISRQR